MKRTVIVGLALLVLALPLMAAHAFVGPEKCKMCHKVEYTSWQATKHAKAWNSLKPAEQSDAKCNGCHSTNLPALTGVSCEACHGAGGDYWKMSVMKDQKLAIQNGLILPTKEVCEKCHNKKSPTFKGFDYEKSKGLVHDVKKK